MLLSEAIRLGSMASYQAFGTLDDGEGGRCAIGAALLAGGVTEWSADWLPADFEIRLPSDCRVNPHPIQLPSAITYLNDVSRWTREEIASWIEGLEQQASQQTVEAPSELVAI